MPMDFPNSPVVGQVFSSGSRSWVWTGTTWDSPGAGNPPIVVTDGVRVFASVAARTSAIPTPAEGMVTYLEDRNGLEYWDGSAWQNLIRNPVNQTNTGLGSNSLNPSTTGGNNTALGRSTLPANTTGGQNVAVGTSSLSANTTGNDNTAVGVAALSANTTASSNTAVGRAALGANTTGASNTALGAVTLQVNTTGVNNAAVGASALQLNTTGSGNTAVGASALFANTTGASNGAFGPSALQSNTTGVNNLAIGASAMITNTVGQANTAIGPSALLSNISGNEHTAVGLSAMQNNTTGAQNTALGVLAGSSTTTGNNNTSLGYNAQPTSATASNEFTLGNASVTNLRCNDTSISSLSDARDKSNVQDSTLGLNLVNELRPVTFDWSRRDGSMAGYKDVGFIAQEIIAVEDKLGVEEVLRMSKRQDSARYEIAPARLIPVLTKAIQELSAQNADLLARLEKLENK